jgi:hypothetical protein
LIAIVCKDITGKEMDAKGNVFMMDAKELIPMIHVVIPFDIIAEFNRSIGFIHTMISAISAMLETGTMTRLFKME